MWVGTAAGGLHRLARRMVDNWGKAEGLLEPSVTSIAEDAAGGYWVASHHGGIWRFQDRQFTKVNERSPAGEYFNVYSTVAADDASIWMAGEQFLLRFRAGQAAQPYLEPPIRGEAIRAMCTDGTRRCHGRPRQVCSSPGSRGG